MTAKRKSKILIIEDDGEVARLQQRCLERAGYEVMTAQTAAGGQRLLRLGIDLLVLDFQLPELDGLEVFERIKQAGRNVPVILISAFSDEATAVKALRAGVRDFVVKSPEYLDFLPDAVERVLNQVGLERQFAQSEARLAGIINSAMDAIITMDCDRRITLFNPAAERMFGCSSADALGQAIEQFIPAAGQDDISFVARSDPQFLERSARLDLFGVRAGGERFPLEVSISTAELDRNNVSILMVRDITEKKKVEAQFLRAQRMESISSLAGGIAHDLNNILTPLVMGVQLLEAVVPEDIQESLLVHMKRSAERGGDMVNQLLAVVMNVAGKRAPVHLKRIVTDMVGMLQRTLPKAILLQTSLPDDLCSVVGDAGQINQIVLNLCLNARNALPLGGKLTLQADNVVLDADGAGGQVHARAGRYVRLTVAHSGPQLPAQFRAGVSEPAPANAAQADDADLGLAAALSLVDTQGGFVDTCPATNGAVFHVHLPAAETTVETGDAPDAAPQGAGELILIVDDETSIGEITKTILETHGYQAMTASSGAQGVGLYTKQRKTIRAVLIDMIMPVMDGLATIAALRKLDPHVPIIAMSGLTAEAKADAAAELGVKIFLPKPYKKETLLASLHDVLEASRSRITARDKAPMLTTA
jgi:PAS domain S-box-containing protein